MKVLVDTTIWSNAFRSKKPKYAGHVNTLIDLISSNKVLILGVIKQEILSGYSELSKFNQLKNKLNPFENTQILDEDYIQAAQFSNTCRSRGIQGSTVDFFICAVAFRLNVAIFTTDKDFYHYQKHIPIKLLP
ncbi:hypothetical protein MNBD_GAMMA01-220 [hydrothermal vent metagenome]|uniref:PIN domain-containing protein n=1 Tax=hydrothermal vent metagenome TaxID=652676 RepID=A0A3B0UY79_9ZZZZ